MKKLLALFAIATLLINTTPVYGATIADDFSTGLLEHWELEETSGNRTGSANSTVLTQVNTVGYGTGIQGNGADLETSSSQYLQVESDLGLNYDSNLTVSVWFSLESELANNSQRVIAQVSLQEARDLQYVLIINRDAGGQNRLRIYSTGPGEQAASYSFTPSTGTLYHAVMAITYNTSTTGMRLYFNGSSVATATSVEGQTGNTVTSRFIIGKYEDLNGGSDSAYWDGIIDEVSVWNRVLDATEVSTLYNSGNGIAYPSAGATYTTGISGIDFY